MGSQGARHMIQLFVPVCPSGDLGATGSWVQELIILLPNWERDHLWDLTTSGYKSIIIHAQVQPRSHKSFSGHPLPSSWDLCKLRHTKVKLPTPHPFISGAELTSQPVHISEVWSKIAPCRPGPEDSWGKGTEGRNRDEDLHQMKVQLGTWPGSFLSSLEHCFPKTSS